MNLPPNKDYLYEYQEYPDNISLELLSTQLTSYTKFQDAQVFILSKPDLEFNFTHIKNNKDNATKTNNTNSNGCCNYWIATCESITNLIFIFFLRIVPSFNFINTPSLSPIFEASNSGSADESYAIEEFFENTSNKLSPYQISPPSPDLLSYLEPRDASVAIVISLFPLISFVRVTPSFLVL